MRNRLITLIPVLIFSASAQSAPNAEDADRNDGALIFEITRVLKVTPNLDREAHDALAWALESAFIPLERSKTKAALDALARTVVLELDGSAAESRSDAISSKGSAIAKRLMSIPGEYKALCSGKMAIACRDEREVAQVVAKFYNAHFPKQPVAVPALPCDGLAYDRTRQQDKALAALVERQLRIPTIRLLRSYSVGTWHVVPSSPNASDMIFMVYASDPLTNAYVALRKGAAPRSEEDAMKRWVEENAPGIPSSLASCFAWEVTH